MKGMRGTVFVMEHARLERQALRRAESLLRQILALANNAAVTDEAFREYVKSCSESELAG